MEIKKIQLVSPLLEKVEEAAQKLIKNPDLKEVEVFNRFIVIREDNILNQAVSATHTSGGSTFAVVFKGTDLSVEG